MSVSLPFDIETAALASIPVQEWARRGLATVHPAHAERVEALNPTDARRAARWLCRAPLYDSWPSGTFAFRQQVTFRLSEHCWRTETGGAEAQAWLAARGIPFGQAVCAIHDPRHVLRLPWKLVARYWADLWWRGGHGALVLDPTQQWALRMHHEDALVFGTHRSDR
ncbi:MAG: hypothetical protein AAGK21_02465 [Bacteroidota bacterium]